VVAIDDTESPATQVARDAAPVSRIAPVKGKYDLKLADSVHVRFRAA